MCFLRISALLFWHTDVHTKFAEVCAIKVKQMCCDFSTIRFVRNSKEISFGVQIPIIRFSKEVLSVAMKNNMHYSKKYTTDSTSVKFAALVVKTTLF